MRRGARAGGLYVPGVRDALVARLDRFDRAFCLGEGCGWCSSRAALLAVEQGERVQVDGNAIWRAMFDERHRHAWARFLHDDTLYVVTGPDTVQPVW